jgi:hypothetical protein
MCSAAAHDPDVAAAHYKNRVCIGGRYGTKFRSAFVLRTPVAPEDVVEVRGRSSSNRGACDNDDIEPDAISTGEGGVRYRPRH